LAVSVLSLSRAVALRWLHGLQESEESGRLSDLGELDAEGLHLNEQVLDVDDLVADQRLQEDAHETDQAILRRERGEQERGRERDRERDRERERQRGQRETERARETERER
jgi:hypothetical protein